MIVIPRLQAVQSGLTEFILMTIRSMKQAVFQAFSGSIFGENFLRQLLDSAALRAFERGARECEKLCRVAFFSPQRLRHTQNHALSPIPPERPTLRVARRGQTRRSVTPRIEYDVTSRSS